MLNIYHHSAHPQSPPDPALSHPFQIAAFLCFRASILLSVLAIPPYVHVHALVGSHLFLVGLELYHGVELLSQAGTVSRTWECGQTQSLELCDVIGVFAVELRLLKWVSVKKPLQKYEPFVKFPNTLVERRLPSAMFIRSHMQSAQSRMVLVIQAVPPLERPMSFHCIGPDSSNSSCSTSPTISCSISVPS